MKFTSRRTFGKQLTAAVASIPILASEIDVSGQGRQKKAEAQGERKEHDTPPPAFFMPGSLIFEAATNKNDWDAFQPTGSHRRKWSVTPKAYPTTGQAPTNIFIAHLKLVSGAGDLLFHFDNDGTLDRATPIHVTATLQQSGQPFGDCHLTVAGDHFELDVPDVKKLKQKNNDPSTNPALRQRVRYMHDQGDDDQCDWVALRIDKGGVNLFYQDGLPSLHGFNDMKMMMWWENLT